MSYDFSCPDVSKNRREIDHKGTIYLRHTQTFMQNIFLIKHKSCLKQKCKLLIMSSLQILSTTKVFRL